jgi:DNA mismatch endonuclease (patch repair protein)
LEGKPDFVFPKKKIALFADGCFWHGHDCRGLKPASNVEYWTAKIARNKKRDKEVAKELKKKGWIVARIWECEIKKGTLPARLKKLFQ